MTDTRGFVGSLKSTISRIVSQDHENTLSESDWLCSSCKKSIQNKMKPRKIQTTNNDIIQKLMEQILQTNLEKVKQTGYIHRKNMLDEFRSAVTGLPSKPDDAEFKFDNFITYKIKKRSHLGYFSGKSKLTNVIIYDKEKLLSDLFSPNGKSYLGTISRFEATIGDYKNNSHTQDLFQKRKSGYAAFIFFGKIGVLNVKT